MTSTTNDDDADSHFKNKRKRDKEAYKNKIDNHFGFEAAKVKTAAASSPRKTMVNTSTGNDSDEDKAALVKRL